MIDVKHKELKKWVKEMAALCKPDKVVLCDGSLAEKKRLEKEAFKTGELIQLNQKKMPGCVYHITAENDVARTEHLTFICTKSQKDAGATNNWMAPEDAYKKAADIFRGSMKGRTMYVIPFSMGPVGSESSKIGVELTDSLYVVLNMRIMTRMGSKVLDVLGTSGEFTKCLHGKAELDVNKRLILHFPEDNTIWSVGSGYGGNVLLGKKCLSLRIGSYLARKEGWLAEHMLIMGIEDPQGRTTYIAGAFPSACGKTNLAMLVPPKALKNKGYKIWCVGDDIAWMRAKEDGALWAINPEAGFFGVAPGTNMKTNPNAMLSVQKDSIHTNVLLKQDKTVWWEGHDDSAPARGLNWRGRQWHPGMKDENGNTEYGAHPNSRFTAPITNCPVASSKLEDPKGVPISAFLFGGRRAQVAPLVYEAFNWQHGVFVGATMASELTAAQYGALGKVRRDPMAMLPFCGYNMTEYWKHWRSLGDTLMRPPRIFHVNWFNTDKSGKFIWPGFGDNLRLIEWIIRRCRYEVSAVETPIGYMPIPSDIDTSGLDITPAKMKQLLNVDKNIWQLELKSQQEFFKQFGKDIPKFILDEHKALEKRINAMG